MFYSLFPIIIAVISSLILFNVVRKNAFPEKRAFFLNYAFGFLLTSFLDIPILIINLGIEIKYIFLLILYLLIFFFNFFSYFFFYRGSILFFTKNKFFNTIFPVVWSSYAVIATTSLLIGGVTYGSVYTIVTWGFLLPINTYLSSMFFYYFKKGSLLDATKNTKERLYMLIFGFGWFSLLPLDGIRWGLLFSYPEELWIIKLASLGSYFMIRSIAYLIILVGCFLYIKKLKRIDKFKQDLFKFLDH